LGQELSFLDNLDLAGKRQLVFAIAAGAVFNFGNLLLIAAQSVSGLAVSFASAWGIALAVGSVWRFFSNPPSNAGLWFGGAAVAIVAVLCAAWGHKVSKAKKPVKAIALAVASGVAMGSFAPLVDRTHVAEIGLGPYALLLGMSIGILVSTFMYSLYFINLPVEGQAVSFGSFRSGTRRQHLLGILGGAMWVSGALSVTLAAAAPARENPGAGLHHVFEYCGPVIAILCGLMIWKEGGRGELPLWLAGLFYTVAVLLGAVALR
jgi:glucose uptake protein